MEEGGGWIEDQIDIFTVFNEVMSIRLQSFHLVLPLLQLKYPLQDPQKKVWPYIVVTEPGSEISDMSAEDMKKMYLSSVFWNILAWIYIYIRYMQGHIHSI